jgi:hypothetical protein
LFQIVSWPVHDLSKPLLMERFYHWAPFIMVGDPGSPH